MIAQFIRFVDLLFPRLRPNLLTSRLVSPATYIGFLFVKLPVALVRLSRFLCLIASMGAAEMPNGLNGVNGFGHNYDYPPSHVDGPYKILDQYHSKPTKLRVACVGAGASGLCLAYKMERMLEPGSWELTLYEKNSQFGGTWYENTYPGVACDIPSHDYNFTWDPKPDWSTFFASGKEIQEYFENFAERHGTWRNVVRGLQSKTYRSLMYNRE